MKIRLQSLTASSGLVMDTGGRSVSIIDDDGKLVWSSRQGPLMLPLHEKLDRILAALAPLGEPLGEIKGCHDLEPDRLIPTVFDEDYQRRLADERKKRCIVLWNAVAYLTTELSRAIGYQKGHSKPSITSEKVLRITRVAQEGGPLGHQGEIVDGVDRLSLSDLERASGAISRPSNAANALVNPDGPLKTRTKIDGPFGRGTVESVDELKKCPACGAETCMASHDRGNYVVCDSCPPMHGPTMPNERLALVAWNAVVDAWNGGFAMGEQV